jgi:hypothetical protein
VKDRKARGMLPTSVNQGRTEFWSLTGSGRSIWDVDSLLRHGLCRVTPFPQLHKSVRSW